MLYIMLSRTIPALLYYVIKCYYNSAIIYSLRVFFSTCQADDRNPELQLTILMISSSIEYAHH